MTYVDIVAYLNEPKKAKNLKKEQLKKMYETVPIQNTLYEDLER
jgi:hypothetical protein